MSKTEIETLLKANAGESSWKEFGGISFKAKRWILENGEANAQYNNFEHQLLFQTKEFVDVANAAQKEKEKKNLEGF